MHSAPNKHSARFSTFPSKPCRRTAYARCEVCSDAEGLQCLVVVSQPHLHIAPVEEGSEFMIISLHSSVAILRVRERDHEQQQSVQSVCKALCKRAVALIIQDYSRPNSTSMAETYSWYACSLRPARSASTPSCS